MSMITRRGFLTGAGVIVGGAAGRVWGGKVKSEAAVLLRPPGAQPEGDFLAACIRCGQCVQACPYDTLHLAGWSAGIAVGTPYLVARTVPCFLCRDHDSLKCIAVCPTGALQTVASIADVRMGVAVINEDTCLAWQGMMCRGCLYACPLADKAIKFDDFYRPVIDDKVCIGCGLCEQACVTEPSSIPIRPAAARDRAATLPAGQGAAQ